MRHSLNNDRVTVRRVRQHNIRKSLPMSDLSDLRTLFRIRPTKFYYSGDQMGYLSKPSSFSNIAKRSVRSARFDTNNRYKGLGYSPTGSVGGPHPSFDQKCVLGTNWGVYYPIWLPLIGRERSFKGQRTRLRGDLRVRNNPIQNNSGRTRGRGQRNG